MSETEKQEQERIEQVLIHKIDALRERKIAVLARKHILGASNPEEFVDKGETKPIENNLSYAAIKRDLLVSDCELEITDLENEIIGRESHLEQVQNQIKRLEDGKNKSSE